MVKVSNKDTTTTSMVALLLLLFTPKKHFHAETLVDVNKINLKPNLLKMEDFGNRRVTAMDKRSF